MFQKGKKNTLHENQSISLHGISLQSSHPLVTLENCFWLECEEMSFPYLFSLC